MLLPLVCCFRVLSRRCEGWFEGKKTPPEPRDEPAELAYACACDMTSGSWVACSRITDWRIVRKLWFSCKDSGVGGNEVVVPIAIRPLGGDVGRKDKVCELGELEWTYCCGLACCVLVARVE